MIKNGFDPIKVSTENKPPYTLSGRYNSKKDKGKSSFGVKLLCLNIVLVLGVSGAVAWGYNRGMQANKEYAASLSESKDSGVLYWVSSFIAKNYEACDASSSDSSYKILSFEGSLSSSLSTVSNKLYSLMYNKLSDCILKAEVLSMESVEEGVEYRLSVTYMPYEKISGVTVDADYLKDACEKYIDKTIGDAEYLSALETVYYKALSKCFTKSSSEHTTEIVLYEREEDGVRYVYGTKSFLDSLIKNTNVRSIMDTYESGIQKEINAVLIEY